MPLTAARNSAALRSAPSLARLCRPHSNRGVIAQFQSTRGFRALYVTATECALTQPGSAATLSMLSNVPLTGAVHFQACGIYDYVPRANPRTDRQ